jgi:amidase
MGKKIRSSDVETFTWTLGLLGRSTSAASVVKSKRIWDQASRAMGRFHQNYDLYLTPTIANPPVKIGALQPKPIENAVVKVINSLRLERLLKLSGILDKLAVQNLAKTPFTLLANFTGQPAMSVPLYWTSDGLPCGIHFMAPFGDEATLFRLAAQLEAEKPWFHRRPNLGGRVS